jgi:hypothetical protein
MFNWHILVLAFVGALAVIGVDYHMQAKTAGVSMSALGVSGYIDSFSKRMEASAEERQTAQAEEAHETRQEASAREHLPKDVAGWSRRAWSDGDNSRISEPKRELSEAEKEGLAQIENSPFAGMLVRTEDLAAEAREAETWVYERGDEIVSVQAGFRPVPKGDGITAITANASKMLRNAPGFSVFDGWAVIQGVAFGEHMPFEPRPYRAFKASIGPSDQVRLLVHADASDDAVRAVLAEIDYDGLNGLLESPLAHVGSDAAEIPLEQQAEVAEAILDGKSDASNARYDAAKDALASDRTSGLGRFGDAMDEVLVKPGLQTQENKADKSTVKEEKGKSTDEASQAAAVTEGAPKPERFKAGDSGVAVCTTKGAMKRCRIEDG